MAADNVGDVRDRHTAVQKAAAVISAMFLLVGILGFVPGITTNYHLLSGALLLGVFQVSVLHNLVHLAFGVAGLAMATSITASRNYLVGGGAVYAVLWIYGLLIDQISAADVVPVNSADSWLHFALAITMIGLGVALSRRRTAAGTAAPDRTR